MQPTKHSEVLQARLLGLINEQFNPEQVQAVTLNTRFQEDLGLDSLDAVELLMAVEDEFQLAEMIDDDLAVKVKTVSELLELLTAEIAKGNQRMSMKVSSTRPVNEEQQ